MLDWSFNDFEVLPLLVSLLLNKETSKDESSLDDLYNADKKELLSDLLKSKETSDFFNLILDAIKSGNFITDESYAKNKLRISNFYNIFVEPVSFFRWAEKQGYSVTYNVMRNVEQREKELRIKNYRAYTISKETVTELMCEPLWLVCDAILYLHGFMPMEDKGLSYAYRNPNISIIDSNDDMKKIHEYLYDANKLNEISIFERSGSKVKPSDFMDWARNLKTSFPNLIITNITKKQNSLNTRERDTLLKLVIGMAIEQYGFDPKAKRNEATSNIQSDLESCGISMDLDTILKKLREASELLPPQDER